MKFSTGDIVLFRHFKNELIEGKIIRMRKQLFFINIYSILYHCPIDNVDKIREFEFGNEIYLKSEVYNN